MAKVMIYDRQKYDFIFVRNGTFYDVKTLLNDLLTGESNSVTMSQLAVWGDDWRNIFDMSSIEKVIIHYDKYGEKSLKYNYLLIWGKRHHMRIKVTFNQLKQIEEIVKDWNVEIEYY